MLIFTPNVYAYIIDHNRNNTIPRKVCIVYHKMIAQSGLGALLTKGVNSCFFHHHGSPLLGQDLHTKNNV